VIDGSQCAEAPPFAGGVFYQDAGIELEVLPWKTITSIAPFRGRTDDVSEALQAAIGVGLPGPNGARRDSETEIVWSQIGQWFLFGPPVEVPFAAMTDQSDGWCGVAVKGGRATTVLARLCPLDLRAFAEGQVARTEVAHRMGLLIGRDDGVEIYVMRSLFQDFLHHLKVAAEDSAAISS